MKKMFLQVEVKKIHSYEAPAYGYKGGYETHYIYDMLGDDGNTYVWKTSKVMEIANRNMDCSCRKENQIYEGDELFIIGNFKCNTEYKGKPQILINRVEVKERMFAALSPEEKLEKQLMSVGPNDRIVVVHYSDYKNKYPNNEVILNSYNYEDKTVEIIIRG